MKIYAYTSDLPEYEWDDEILEVELPFTGIKAEVSEYDFILDKDSEEYIKNLIHQNMDEFDVKYIPLISESDLEELAYDTLLDQYDGPEGHVSIDFTLLVTIEYSISFKLTMPKYYKRTEYDEDQDLVDVTDTSAKILNLNVATS